MDYLSLLIMALALAAGAVVKGATGMGLPLVALPVLASTFGLPHAIGIMTIPLIATNIWQVIRFRGERHAPGLAFLPRFLAGGAVGMVVGTFLLVSLPERLLILTLGLLLLGYAALKLSKPHIAVGTALALTAGPLVGFGAGALQGATGISAPIGVTFIHAMRLPRDAHVYAVSTMFLLFALLQLPTLAVAGIMQASWLVQGVLALIPIMLFMPVGQWLADKLSNAAFDRLILAFLTLVGAKMVLGL